MKLRFWITTVALIVMSFSLGLAQSFSLESVDGLHDGNPAEILADGSTTITFNIRLSNDDSYHEGISNGWRVYSLDGAEWTATVPDTISWGWVGYNVNIPGWAFFDTYGINTYSGDGLVADTVGFGGTIMQFCSGLPAGFNEVAYTITVGPIDPSMHGHTIVLDSSYYRPTGYWMFAGPSVDPDWDGPHTFTCIDPDYVPINQPPVLDPIGPQGGNEGTTIQFTVEATDPNGTTPALTWAPGSGLEAAMFTDNGNGTGTFEWTTTYDDAGTYEATFTASDGEFDDEELVTITVTDVNRAPVLADIGLQGGDEGTTVTFAVSATDPDGTIPSLTMNPGSGLEAATFTDHGDGTGTFEWATTFDDAGSYQAMFTASDGLANDQELVTITITEGNQAPVLAEIGPQGGDEGTTIQFTVTATDPDGTYPTLTMDPGTGLEAATFTDNGDGTGTFSWLTTYDDAGSYQAMFTASDGFLTDEEEVTITVNDVNRAPVLAEIGPQTVIADMNLNFTVTATDPDGGFPDLSADPLPGTATFVDNGDGTGTFDWTPTAALIGDYDVTFVASDGDLSDDEIVTISVIEPAKMLVATPNELNFSGYETGPNPSMLGFTVTELGGTEIDITATEAVDWLNLDGFTAGVTPAMINVAVDISGLGVGTYDGVVAIASEDAENSPIQVAVHLAIAERLNEAPVFASGIQDYIIDECTTLDITITATDADQDPLTMWMEDLAEGMSFTDLGGGSLQFVFEPNFSQAGVYQPTVFVTDDRETVSTSFMITVDECEPGTEGDTVTVATVPAVPGAQVMVQVDFANLCDVSELYAAFDWTSDYLMLDSASFADSRLAGLAGAVAEINNDEDWVKISAGYTDLMLVVPGSGVLVNLYFSLAVECEPGFYPLDLYIDPVGFTMNPSYTRDCGSGPETTLSYFIPGGIVVDISGNYVCGYVVDPDGLPVPGATVELWDDFPGMNVVATTSSSGTGVFAFSDFTTIPFDLWAYKDGYYPGKVENINFAQSGIEIVLTPYEPVTVTNTNVRFHCDYNTYTDALLPVGSIIDAYDPDEVRCGTFMVTEAGKYGFLYVYGDDEWEDGDQGAEPGDVIRFFVNGVEALTTGDNIWTENLDVHEVCLDVPGYVAHSCDLVEGWNLVSWNVDTETDDIFEVLASIDGCLEVVMGFEQGALTYDASLPLFSDLWQVDHLSGYWIKVSCDVTLEVVGMPVPVTTPIRVTTGWNLVSYLPEMAMPTADALATVHDDLVVALGYDGGGLTYDPNGVVFSDLTELSSCFGYWLKVVADGDLIYPGEGPVLAAQTSKGGAAARANTVAGVTPTTRWVNLYSRELTLNGASISAGADIAAVTADGVKVGGFTMSENGLFGFMPVYGDDPATDAIDGVRPGERFSLTVNGIQTEESFVWSSSGDRMEIGGLTAKGTSDGTLPISFSLNQNYPNPFNPTTTISFTLPSTGTAKLEVYNLLGKLVATPFDGVAAAGLNEIVWDGKNSRGITVASGIYFYRLTADKYTETRKMTLLK